MDRRVSTLVLAAVCLAGLVIMSVTVRVPLVAMGPGPVFDTLGRVEVPAGTEEGGMPTDDDQHTEIKPVVEITGAVPDETTGIFDMTTVAVRQNLTFGDAVRLWLDPHQQVVPRDQVFPPDRTQEQVDQQNADLMVGSENSAAQAAFRHLKLPMVPTVQGLATDAAASGILRENDRIMSIDGTEMDDAQAVVDYVADKLPGDTITVELERPALSSSSGDGADDGDAAGAAAGDAERLTETIKLKPGDPNQGQEADQGYLGIMLGDMPANGTNVTINLSDSVGGPSAGLMFALAIVDKLSPGELTGGRHIAGTGEISGDGEVGPIGGIGHKIVAASEDGATEFLVPAANCGEALTNPPEGIELIKVETLDGAIEALQTVADGGTPELCSAG